MKTQLRTGFKFILFILFLINSHFKSQQLALPNHDLTIVSKKNTVNESVTCYGSRLFRSYNNIISCRSIFNNMNVECLSHDNVTQSIITKSRFLNNQSHFPGVQKNRKIFQLTKFFT